MSESEKELTIAAKKLQEDFINQNKQGKINLFKEQNKFFEVFGCKDTQDFINQCKQGKIIILPAKSRINENNEMKRLEEIETKFNRLNEEFQYMGYDDVNDFLRKWLDENKVKIIVNNPEPSVGINNVNKYKAENIELKQQIIELKRKNKQLCKDAERFLKKKDSTNKLFQDLEFIKKMIGILQKDYENDN